MRPDTDEVFTIEPPPAAFSAGTAACMPRKQPTWFTLMTDMNSSRGWSSIMPTFRTPALLMRTSSLPNVDTAVSTALFQSSGCVTSRWT